MLVSPYAEFLQKKLFLIEHTTGCLFKDGCNEKVLKDNMFKIRNICGMSNSAVDELLKGIEE